VAADKRVLGKEIHDVATNVDVIDFCIDDFVRNIKAQRMVRASVVSEQSKARVITVSPISYMILANLCSGLLKGIRWPYTVASGMNDSNHLWNFSTLDLEKYGMRFDKGRIFGLSTDLETATDFANPHIARWIFSQIREFYASNKAFPHYIFSLVENVFCGERYVFHSKYSGRTVEMLNKMCCMTERVEKDDLGALAK
jgi:hypothetical protein